MDNHSEKTVVLLTRKDSFDTTRKTNGRAFKKEAQTVIVTERFLKIVNTICCLGFISDPIKYKEQKLSPMKYPWKAKIRLIDSNVFYELPFELSIPKLNYDHFTRYPDIKDQDKNCIDLEKYKKVQRIIAYDFIKYEQLMDKNDTINKFYPNGVIEEWTFPTNNTAMLASTDWTKKAESITGKGTVFICIVDKYMYVFYSYDAACKQIIKQFYDRFVRDNNATVPNSWLPFKPLAVHG